MSKRKIYSILTVGVNSLLILLIVLWAMNVQCINAQEPGGEQERVQEKAQLLNRKLVDIYIRDNPADNGNTPTPNWWWISPDIKFDAPPFQYVTSFEKIKDEKVIPGKRNRVYLQVHNRGVITATVVTVNLYWAYAGGGLPQLPIGFWTQFPGPPLGLARGNFVGQKFIINLQANQPQYTVFDWTVPRIDHTKPIHFCLLAITDCCQDPVSAKQLNPDYIVRNDNNITLRNIFEVNPNWGKPFDISMYISNPTDAELRTRIRIIPNVVSNWEIPQPEEITLRPLEQRLVTLNINTPTEKPQPATMDSVRMEERIPNQEVTVSITQEGLFGTPPNTRYETMGGVTLSLRPRVKSTVLGKYSFSLHGGLTYPMTDFGILYRSSYMYGINFDYHFTPQFSAVAFAGFNHFRPKHNVSYLGNTHWWNFSANLKWEFSTNMLRPYVNSGFGFYIPKTGPTQPGFNVGGGLNLTLNPSMVLELGADYHHILTTAKDAQYYTEDPVFLTTHLGLIFRF